MFRLRAKVKEAMLYHHLSGLKEEMKANKKLDRISNEDCRMRACPHCREVGRPGRRSPGSTALADLPGLLQGQAGPGPGVQPGRQDRHPEESPADKDRAGGIVNK